MTTQADVGVFALPLHTVKENALMVNAVQRFAWGAEWAAARARVVSRVPSGTGVAAPARVIRDLDAALLGFPEVMTPMFVQPWRTRKSPRPFPSWPTCSS